MRSRRKPFQQGKITPVAVTPTESGYLWLGAKGYISPNTNPVELQEKQKKQAQVSLLILEAAEALAAAKGISSSEARKSLFPSEVKQKDGDAIVQVDATEAVFDWLTLEQKTLYFTLTQEAADIPIKVATMMMVHRVLYSIDITESAKTKAKSLAIAEPWFDLHPGDRISVAAPLSPILVKITSTYDVDSGTIDVEPLPAAIGAGSTGFLLDGSTYAIGDPNWTEEDTLNLSLECADQSVSQIAAINNFYLRESGRLVETDEGKDLTPENQASQMNGDRSESSLTLPASTGENSTGESNHIGSKMTDSTERILETALTG